MNTELRPDYWSNILYLSPLADCLSYIKAQLVMSNILCNKYLCLSHHINLNNWLSFSYRTFWESNSNSRFWCILVGTLKLLVHHNREQHYFLPKPQWYSVGTAVNSKRDMEHWIWDSHSGDYEEQYRVGYKCCVVCSKSTEISEEHIIVQEWKICLSGQML